MRRSQTGMTLVEILVATTLLLVVTAGSLSAWSRAQSTRRDAGTLQQLHERAQFVFASLEPELQMAGYFGVSGVPARLADAAVPAGASRCGAQAVGRLDQPVEVHASWDLPCAANGGGARVGSAVLIIRRLASQIAAGPEAGRAQWLATRSPTEGGRLYWNGEAPWNPAELPRQELRDLLVRIYYVARKADGEERIPALRVKSLSRIAGVPAFIDTEVMNGIEDLQVELLPPASAPRTVRIRLRIRADPGALRPGTASSSIEVEREFSLRNGAA